jgi:hypothetical protein
VTSVGCRSLVRFLSDQSNGRFSEGRKSAQTLDRSTDRYVRRVTLARYIRNQRVALIVEWPDAMVSTSTARKSSAEHVAEYTDIGAKWRVPSSIVAHNQQKMRLGQGAGCNPKE